MSPFFDSECTLEPNFFGTEFIMRSFVMHLLFANMLTYFHFCYVQSLCFYINIVVAFHYVSNCILTSARRYCHHTRLLVFSLVGLHCSL